MCTSLSFKTKDHYFGRNLDYEFGYNESVTVTPRNFVFRFRHAPALETHYALIGMAFVVDDYPLYYEATNEAGLSMAGLNFPGFARYFDQKQDKINVAPFEFVPYVLAQCANVAEARKLLADVNLCAENFSDKLPASPLHWHIADANCSIVAESADDGLKIYDDPVNVMTNSPTFDFHMLNLSHYMGATREIASNRFAPNVPLKAYSRGAGGFGLPGDLSSASRFVRAAFALNNSVCDGDEASSVGHFFQLLGSVAQQKGSCAVEHGYEYTIYSCCCNTARGVYYYTTYNNGCLTAVDMHREDLNRKALACYPMRTEQQVVWENASSATDKTR